MAGSREELAAHVAKYGSSYRTVIKPGEIDSGMWVLTSSPSQIFEVSGQGRLLGADELDIEGTFKQCDNGGDIGKVDYICSNMPKTAYSCSNYVHPKPAALTFPKKGTYTVASTEDCLEAYDYLSKHRKSDDPVAVKQAIEAASAFRARCKLTDEQQTAVDQTITSTQNHLQRIQSNTSQTKSPDDNLLSGTDAVKRIDIDGLKQQFADLMNSYLGTGGYVLKSYVSIERGKLKIQNVYSGVGIRTVAADFSTFETSVDQYTQHFGGGFFLSTNADGFNFPIQQSFDITIVKKSTDKLLAEIRAAEKGYSGDSQERNVDDNLPKIEPTTVEEYQKKVVVEAKAKGINLSPNYLTDGSNTSRKTPSARLTPTQKTAQDTTDRQKLSDLIVQDTQNIAEELKVNAEIERKQAEEERKIAEAERKKAEEEKRRRDNLEAERKKDNEYAAKKDDLKKRFKDGSVFDFPQFPPADWIYDNTSEYFQHRITGKNYGAIRLELDQNNYGSFEQMTQEVLEITKKYKDDVFKSMVEGHSLDGKRKVYVITKTNKKFVNRLYFFEGDDRLVYKISMTGFGSSKDWVILNGDALARSLIVK